MRALICRLNSLDRITSTCRTLCSIRFDASDQEVEDLINSRVEKSQRQPAAVGQVGRTVLTTRREALALYRDVLRTSSLFDWPDQQGRIWRDVIRNSARQEYEQARYEKDPEVINRLLVVGRDALHRVGENFAKKYTDMGQTDVTHDK